MKIMVVLISLLIALSPNLAWSQQKQEKQSSYPGRYQLFQGEYMFVNIDGEQHWSKALFKIDTATGNIFICDQWQIDGKYEGKDGQVIQRRTCKPFDEEMVFSLSNR